MAKLNERIKERRLAKGLTLLEVAEKLGVKEATAQRYESGAIKNIPYETVEYLATILDCSPEYLMGWTNRINRKSIYHKIPNEALMVNEDNNTYGSNVAAHRDSDENWTPEELKKIEEYKQLLLDARNNKK